MTRNEFFEIAKTKAVKFGKAAWDYIKLAKMELIVLVAALIVDLVSKSIVEHTMTVGRTKVLIPNFLQLTFIYNPLAAFGSAFGLDKLIGRTATRIIFIVITFVAVGIFGYFMYRNRGKNKVERLAFALIISGAIGNLVDRIFIGEVRDFIEIVYFGLDLGKLGTSFAIFNIADAALVVGVILFLVYILFLHKEPQAEEVAAGTSVAADGADAEQAATAENTAEPDNTETPQAVGADNLESPEVTDAPESAAAEKSEENT